MLLTDICVRNPLRWQSLYRYASFLISPYVLVWAAWSMCLGYAVGQNTLQEKRINFQCYQCEVEAALLQLAQQHNLGISFSPNFFASCSPVTLNVQNKALEEVVKEITACAKVKVEWEADQIIIRALRHYTVSGRVVDTQTGEWLIGATIRVEGGGYTVSNEYGFYSLRIVEGTHRLSAFYVGHRLEKVVVEVKADLQWNFRLTPDAMLREVTILSRPAKEGIEPSASLSSGQSLSLEAMRRTPMLGGEGDLMRYATLLPGVLTGADGLGGLHVRGGNADQNLFLLDEVPVYNPSHALGLLSIFPASAVNYAQFWKGDFPARYGGRAASVIDIRLRDGNGERYQGEGAAGLFASSFSLEGPLLRGSRREKSSEASGSFLATGRFTYLAPWLQLLERRYRGALFLSGDDVRYRFYDLTFKANYKFSQREQVHLSAYFGGDAYRNQLRQTFSSSTAILNDQYTLGASWGNNIVALRWNRILAPGIFFKTILRYSRFNYQSQQDLLSESFQFISGKRKTVANYAQRYQTLIEDVSVQAGWEFRLIDNLAIHAGLSYAFHTFEPGALSVNFLLPGQSPLLADSLAKTLFNRERVRADEFSLHTDLSWDVWKGGRIEAGLFLSSFEIRNRTFWLFQPRLRYAQRLGDGLQAWAGYHHMGQFLHQVGTFNLNFPFELWVPTTPRALPEEAWQATLGFRLNGADWALSVEGFYKNLTRVLAFRSSTTALLSAGAEDASGWEDRIISGTGWAKGIELTAQKGWGRALFSANYTLSRAMRQFPEWNAGEPFPFRFDRPHVLNVSAHYRPTPWLDISALWVYASGNPITLATVKFQHQTYEENASPRDVLVYGRVNSYRLPNYHRLDLFCRFSFVGRKCRHELLLGAYNVYNQVNPFFRYIDAAIPADAGRAGAIQYNLLPFLPEVRYSFRF